MCAEREINKIYNNGRKAGPKKAGDEKLICNK